MRIHSTLLALAASAFVAVACGGGDSNAPDNSHVGQYALESIDAERLPITVYEDATTLVKLTEGSLTLNVNGTFAQSIKFTLTQNGISMPPGYDMCSGTYRRSASTVTLTSPGSDQCAAGTITGTLSGNVLTMNDGGSVVVYRR